MLLRTRKLGKVCAALTTRVDAAAAADRSVPVVSTCHGPDVGCRPFSGEFFFSAGLSSSKSLSW